MMIHRIYIMVGVAVFISFFTISCSSDKPKIGMVLAPVLAVGWEGEYERGSEYPSDEIFNDNSKLVRARAGGGDWGGVVAVKLDGEKVFSCGDGGCVFVGGAVVNYIGKEITVELERGDLNTDIFFFVKELDYVNKEDFVLLKKKISFESINKYKSIKIGLIQGER